MKRLISLPLLSLILTLLPWGGFVDAGRIQQSLSPTGLKSGLVGHWTFDGADVNATQVLDKSGQGKHGTRNSVTMAKGKIGQAAGKFLAGESGRISFASPITFAASTTYSYSLWVKRTGGSGGRYTGGEYWGFLFDYPVSQHAFRTTAVGDAFYSFTSSLGITNWTHLVWVADTNDNLTLYENGVFKQTQNVANSAVTIQNIGSSYYLGAAPFNGSIDDVRVYSRALSLREIQELYKMGGGKIQQTITPTGLKSGLVGHWTFDGADVNATQVLDKSGQGNNGTRSGGVKMATGKIGQGGKFDGGDDYVKVSNSANLNFGTGSFTINIWVKTTWSGEGQKVVIRKDLESQSPRTLYDFSFNSPYNKIVFQIYHSVSGSFQATSITSINNGKWYHVTGVRDSLNNQIRIYVNGILEATTSISTFDTDNTGILAIGGATESAGYNFSGSLDDIRIWNRALSLREIQELYKMGGGKIQKTITPTGLASGLVGHWTFDGVDVGATYVLDKSGQGNTGTRQGGMVMAKGKIGQGGKFDGSNDYVNMGDKDDLIGTNYTWSFWLNPKGVTATQNILSKINAGFTNGIIILMDAGAIAVYADTNSSDCVTTISANTWSYVAAIVNSSGCYLYVNGVLKDTGTATTVTDNDSNFVLGYEENLSARYLNGKIDDVRIYNRALSLREIQMLYQMGR